MTESKPAVHTATPWRVENGTYILAGVRILIADTSDTSLGREEQEANARLIVRSVNAHQPLVDALRTCRDNSEEWANGVVVKLSHEQFAEVQRALALAEEQ